MTSVYNEYTAAYERHLRTLLNERPEGWTRTRFITVARKTADGEVPEGRVCMAASTAAATGKGGTPYTEYEVQVGAKIIGALRRINLRLLGSRKAPKTAAPRLPDAPGRPPRPTAVRRPARAQHLALADRYAAWAATHDVMPGDTMLAAFTEWGPSTWAAVRQTTELRGFKFQARNRSGFIKVTARPANGPGAAEPLPLSKLLDRVAYLEAELKRLTQR